ncbi:BREX-1 system adenine-specific DNA-methyltransferase PglX [Lagierella massiliensis]|uniref:BREX-1 system adenine-specific DNA-methyltransferase PglX n=1 Tax=Lagierella massiliensis TaxID=1689303 RepID=UPI0006D7AFC7|nr:BREX-1 system adenine-specific DNA-methyltransferase PglX [Lagierella massiliensis]
MNKNAIKKFATEARRELISRVSQRALKYGISNEEIGNPNDDTVNGYVLSTIEKKQRADLIKQIKDKGYEQVIEEVSYTWFNRFCALRFMEVNGYLPTRVRVFTDENNNFKPQIMTEAIHMDFDGLDKDKVFLYKQANENDELYKYLLITQCNALNSILPGMFQKISDYTELLFPDNLLRDGSIISQMIELIPEEDWEDEVEIIGWLYQYYNSEKKDEVFLDLKKNIKITKENIPAATQLFTPDWIVRYMVENSLGRLWLEDHPNEELKSKWRYYLDEAEQEKEVQEQIDLIREEYKKLSPEDIKCYEPCSGSGHILAYMFDVLVDIYMSQGYNTRTAVRSIVENNLYGLDIDDRAAQLAYFSVMMKGRQYDRGFFRRGISPNVYAIAESNHVDNFTLEYFSKGDEKLKEAMDTIIKELYDAKEYGSLVEVTTQDFDKLYSRFDEIIDDIDFNRDVALKELLPLVRTAEILSKKYDVVVTNPPYMGSSNMNSKLSDYVKKNFKDSKSDLFAVFIEKCGQMTKLNGYQAMITQHAWMFLSSFEKLRIKILNTNILNMAHLGARAFEEIGGEVVQTTSFVIRKSHIENFKGRYCRLIEPTSQQGKEEMLLAGKNRYSADQSNFSKIPGSPLAYWVSDSVLSDFQHMSLGTVAPTKKGLDTGENDKFLRYWHEPAFYRLGIGYDSSDSFTKEKKKWAPHDKGGDFRRWYGNKEWIINWENNGFELHHSKANLRSERFYFHKAITWGSLSSGNISFRYSDYGALSNTAGSSIYPEENVFSILGFLNTKVTQYLLDIISPTLNYSAGPISQIPVIDACNTDVATISSQCVDLAKADWDSFETSWDFKHHSIAREVPTITEAFYQWQSECDDRFNQLKANEEELNRIFIDIYGLQDELTPEVADKDITVYRIFDSKEDVPESMKGSRYIRMKEDEVVSFISYAVGCMFGRYSLDVDGLAYAGGDWDASKYSSFAADKDNIIPISDDEYFEDDIVGRFVKFVEVVYGKDTLEENLNFIADALGGNGQPKDVIRKYFLNGFYKDHCKMYQKRPIYWMFDSGKENGFKCLIYMHRYEPDIIARIRTDYVHEQQSRYRTAILDLENRIESASTSERVKLSKKLKTLNEQAEEILNYEEKIHHLADQMISIDLDDGVKNNYAIFKDVLAKIR